MEKEHDRYRKGGSVYHICQRRTSYRKCLLRDIDRVHKKAEYGIFIGEKDALGKGYGTQAARIIIHYAFEQLGLHKLMLRLLADNKQAYKSYEKAGFVQEAYLKDEVYLEGTYKDVIYMAVINQKL